MSFTTNSTRLLTFIHQEYPKMQWKKHSVFALLYRCIRLAMQKLPAIVALPKVTAASAHSLPKPEAHSYNSVPPNIRRHIESNIRWRCEFECTIGVRRFRFFCLTETKPSRKFLAFWMESVRLWFELISPYASATCTQHSLEVYFYMTRLEKQLPRVARETMNMNHVNTAFTYTCRSQNEIVVFRKEEWLKVLMHESFHTFGLDFSEMDNARCHRRIRANLFRDTQMASKINVYEAYAECWAEVWNLAFSVFFQERTASPATFVQEASYRLQVEQLYTCFQLVKTLGFMGFTYDSLCDNRSAPVFKEDTNVLSYFILKAILLVNATSFFHWCNIHNGAAAPFVFQKTPRNQHAFCSFLEANYRSPYLLKWIHFSEHILRKNHADAFLSNNMRMSVFELEPAHLH
jgi:hypothetical protein